ncbi:ankyrin repeat domain-containing protein [bacterium]|nr:ankyrin repeat domain-containing protein [bacterium]
MNWKLIVALLAALCGLLLQPGNVLAQPPELDEEMEWVLEILQGWARTESSEIDTVIPEFLEIRRIAAEQGIEVTEDEEELLSVIRLLADPDSVLPDELPELPTDHGMVGLSGVLVFNAIASGRPEVLRALGITEQLDYQDDPDELLAISDLMLERAIRNADLPMLEVLGESGARLSSGHCMLANKLIRDGGLEPAFATDCIRACGLRRENGEWMAGLGVLLPWIDAADIPELLPEGADFSFKPGQVQQVFLPAMCSGNMERLHALEEAGLDIVAYCQRPDLDPLVAPMTALQFYSDDPDRHRWLASMFNELSAAGVDLSQRRTELEALYSFSSAFLGLRLYAARLADWEQDAEGSLEVLEVLAANGVDIGLADGEGMNLLGLLAALGRPVPDEVFIRCQLLGVDPLQLDADNRSPLSYIVGARRDELAAQLYAQAGREDAFSLAMLGRAEDFEAALGQLDGETAYRIREQALMLLGEMGRSDLLGRLAGDRLDIPLQATLLSGDAALLERMLSEGNDNVTGDYESPKPLPIAARAQDPRVLELLLGHPEFARWLSQRLLDEALQEAITNYRLEQMEMLLDAGASLEKEWKDHSDLDSNPLHLAARLGWVEGVTALLARGANPNRGLWKVERYGIIAGYPPLYDWCIYPFARQASAEVELDWLECARLLVAGGAELNFHVPYGSSGTDEQDYLPVLNIISWSASPELMRLMLELGADPALPIIHELQDRTYMNWYESLFVNLAGIDGIDLETFSAYADLASDEELEKGIGACIGIGHSELLQALLDRLDRLPAAEAQQDALDTAAYFRRPDCMRQLLEHGFRVQDADGLLDYIYFGGIVRMYY